MQDSGSLAVFKTIARDQGHYKGPSGAFVTYCNISFFFFFLFVRFGFFIQKITFSILCIRKFHLSYPPPTHRKKIIHLCIILWILVQSYTVSDLILFGGHCDLYIMVQRFCLVSLTISNRKISYRSLKLTVGSTSCPWRTILVSSSSS